ncbi:MAG: prepilin-type N-terminal cleavage/methylation domain-containing protein [Gallionella sp.]|nr:MAG: prepilin-type N-terminal cleavage/methylation domain-containing protein [Gallionella sp.]
MLNAFPANRHSGFSLTELMVGIAIMGILLGLAMPSFRIWLQNSQIRNAAESVQNGIQRARAEAVARNTNVEFVLGVDSSWVVRVANPVSVIESRASTEGSQNVTRTVLPAGATTITFSNLGAVATNADASAALAQVDLDSPLLSAADSKDLRVTVGVGGNARMCDPNLASGSSPRAC